MNSMIMGDKELRSKTGIGGFIVVEQGIHSIIATMSAIISHTRITSSHCLLGEVLSSRNLLATDYEVSSFEHALPCAHRFHRR